MEQPLFYDIEISTKYRIIKTIKIKEIKFVKVKKVLMGYIRSFK
ncbi:hypothetical protein CLH_1603 [Clostridium botulinum E3 str. Alaska E43]|nr:hypothetical protein CLH_1603 [Clostridium botulinum E3 str. Alaska E43]